jgi:hypothetical protein
VTRHAFAPVDAEPDYTCVECGAAVSDEDVCFVRAREKYDPYCQSCGEKAEPWPVYDDRDEDDRWHADTREESEAIYGR